MQHKTRTLQVHSSDRRCVDVQLQISKSSKSSEFGIVHADGIRIDARVFACESTNMPPHRVLILFGRDWLRRCCHNRSLATELPESSGNNLSNA